MVSQQKAERATITLGSIDLEVFLLENGEYRLSRSQILDVVDEIIKDYPRFLKNRGLDLLPCMMLKHPPIVSTTIKITYPLSIEQASIIWAELSSQGNVKAKLLMFACAAEALERRADAKFGKIRSEEERNQRIIARTESKNLFFEFSTEISSWFDRTKAERSQPVERYYSAAYDAINRGLFGKTSKQIRTELGVPTSALIRDHFNAESLRRITQVQSISAGQMRKNVTLRPLDAAKFALDCSCFDVIEFKI